MLHGVKGIHQQKLAGEEGRRSHEWEASSSSSPPGTSSPPPPPPPPPPLLQLLLLPSVEINTCVDPNGTPATSHKCHRSWFKTYLTSFCTSHARPPKLLLLPLLPRRLPLLLPEEAGETPEIECLRGGRTWLPLLGEEFMGMKLAPLVLVLLMVCENNDGGFRPRS